MKTQNFIFFQTYNTIFLTVIISLRFPDFFLLKS